MSVAVPVKDPEIERRLRRAFDRLPILDGREAKLDEVIDLLALIAATVANDPEAKSIAAFRDIAPCHAEKELAEIVKRVRELANALKKPNRSTARRREQLALRLENMHRPTISALADTPPVEDGGMPGLLNVEWVRFGLPKELRNLGDNANLAARLDRLADAATKASVTTGRAASRPPNNRAHIIGDIVAKAYFEATGKAPTLIIYRRPKRKPMPYAGQRRRGQQKTPGPGGPLANDPDRT
jgi:hypothetical protein